MPGEPDIIEPREVRLGSDEGMPVRRTLPTRHRSLIGGWCFVDHYGPADVSVGGGMQVAAHPHTGLQTASWLFSGEVEHRDSAGHHALIVPGELNLMTAGRGISHSELSTAHDSRLHGVQLWIALPDASRFIEPTFEHVVPDVASGPGFTARTFIGSLLGSHSPAQVHSAMLGSELRIEPGSTLDVPVDASFEHGVLLDSGAVRIAGSPLRAGELAHLEPGRASLRIEALEPSRLLLLGGEPLGESILMWWNFIGRTHEEIVAFREQWQAEVAGAATTTVFGMPVDDSMPALSAPALPNARLKLRG